MSISPYLHRTIQVATLICAWPVLAQLSPSLTNLLEEARFSRMEIGPVAASWREVGLPGQTLPLTRFDIQSVDGNSVLRIRTDASYGNLVIGANGERLSAQARLHWRWQLASGLPASDLQHKEGDDTPMKICALFDMALGGLSMSEQARLRMARLVSGEHLPAATLCYVWDRLLPQGRVQKNIFSPRVRYLVVSAGPAQPGVWHTIERQLAQDFLQVFGDESAVVPPLIALAVGADADNTGGNSLAFIGDIHLAPR